MKIAIILGEGFQDAELIYPYYHFLEMGYPVDLVSLESNKRYGSQHGYGFISDKSFDEAGIYDMLIIPGGRAPDFLRTKESCINFIQKHHEKIIGAICHGPQLLIEAGLCSGKNMTSYSAVKTDLINSGAKYLDEPVVVNGLFVTSRIPEDLPDFCRELINLI